MSIEELVPKDHLLRKMDNDIAFGYARLRGMGKVFEQCLLCAAVQNMKKIAGKGLFTIIAAPGEAVFADSR